MYQHDFIFGFSIQVYLLFQHDYPHTVYARYALIQLLDPFYFLGRNFTNHINVNLRMHLSSTACFLTSKKLKTSLPISHWWFVNNKYLWKREKFNELGHGQKAYHRPTVGFQRSYFLTTSRFNCNYILFSAAMNLMVKLWRCAEVHGWR